MNEFIDQVKQFWSELGVNQKVSIALAFTLVMAGVAAMLVWASRPQMVMLYGGLDPKDLSSVVQSLDDQAIPYEIRQGSSVYVPRANVYQMRMDLASQGIPSGGGVGFEIFDKTNFGVSDFVQRTNYIRAIQGELSRTIAQMKGVRDARVMIVVPENRLVIAGEKSRSTASVSVDTGGNVLNTESVNAIRFLVANAVEGLLVEDVVVADANGNLLSQGLVEDEVIGAASGQFKFRKNLEDYFTQKIETMLERVVGKDNVVARVSVSINTEASTTVEEKFDPASQVVRTQTLTDDASTQIESNSSDVAGLSSNTPGESPTGLASTPSTKTTSSESHKDKSVTYEINRSKIEVVRQPGEIDQVSAAVFIARRFSIGDDGKKIVEPRTPEELERLRQMVINALGVGRDGNTTTVNTVSLEETDFAIEEEPTPDTFSVIEENVFRFADLFRNFVAVTIAVIIFFSFTRMLKRHKPEAVHLEVVEEHRRQQAKEDEFAPRLTPELLNELIREKPENVSTALKNWAIEQKK